MSIDCEGVKLKFGDPRQPKALPLAHVKARWGEWGTKTILLKKGSVQRRGALALPCDIKFERDVPVHLRDGTRIYVDVFRPTTEAVKAPAIINWSPYGKQPGKGIQILDDFPFRMGVPLGRLSELQRWEGPDPAYWVGQGYAIVNADPRGVYKSEGDIYSLGTQEGRDGADLVDWIGEQPWCSGKVGLSGNSYAAAIQWFIAAEQPRHLAAIAPWEGASDYFREFFPGGVLTQRTLDFSLRTLSANIGENSWENPPEMLAENPTLTSYVEDKAARMLDVAVPAYVVASYSNPMLSYGPFRAFARLRSEKWLRVHDSWAWTDYYDEGSRADLLRFFDHFLRGATNEWGSTPRVRARIIDTANSSPLTGTLLTSSSFPPAETRPLRLHFNTEARTIDKAPPTPSSATFQAIASRLTFTHIFTANTILSGPLDLRLAVSLHGGTDADIYVSMEKILGGEKSATQLIVPYSSSWQSWFMRRGYSLGVDDRVKLLFYRGPWGAANVARRAVVTGSDGDDVPGLPVTRMDITQPVAEGEVVLVQPALRPIGMFFRAGEALRVTVSGVDESVYPEVTGGTLKSRNAPDVNSSGVKVTIHCGEDKSGLESCLSLPVVPGGGQ